MKLPWLQDAVASIFSLLCQWPEGLAKEEKFLQDPGKPGLPIPVALPPASASVC